MSCSGFESLSESNLMAPAGRQIFAESPTKREVRGYMVSTLAANMTDIPKWLSSPNLIPDGITKSDNIFYTAVKHQADRNPA